MAIQFPNFLNAPQIKPDYSGVGDIFENFYKGKAMPQDDLIKRIQAQFAQPNSEQTLANARQELVNNKLTAQKYGLDIEKLRRELAQDADFQQALKLAQQNRGQSQQVPQAPLPLNMPQAQPPAMTPINPSLGTALAPQKNMSPVDDSQGFDPTLMDRRFIKTDQQATGLPRSAYNPGAAIATPVPSNMPDMTPKPVTINGATPEQTSALQQAGQPTVGEQVLNEGNPNEFGVDAMWENRPDARPYLEKRGYTKTVKTSVDKKTGANIVETKLPSGRIIKKTITQAVKPEDLEAGIPLTKTVLTSAVKQVRGTDAVLPYIDELIKMGGASLDKNGDLVRDKNGKIVITNNQLPNIMYGPLAYGNANSTYSRIVNNALEKYMAASGFNQTDKSTEKVEKIMERGGWESNENYLEQMAKERKSMIAGRGQNVQMITKGMKKYPDFGSGSDTDPTAGMSDQQLEAIANG